MAPRRPLIPAALRGFLQLALQVALALALVVVLQFTASRHNRRFDFTPTRAYLLSPYAQQVAESFPEAAAITAFYDGGSGDRYRMLDLLQQFGDANPRLSFRLADLDHSPALAQKLGVASYNTGVIESGGQRLTLRSVDEQEIVATLLKLSRAEPHRICFVTGHGERDPENGDPRTGLSQLAKSLQQQRFATAGLHTVAQGVPESCFILVFAGPSHDLVAGEAEVVAEYVRGGGQALMLIDPGAPATFTRLLADLGVEAGNNVVVDEANRMVGADSFVVQVVRFRPDVFQDHLRAAAILPVARTMHAAEQRPAQTEVVPIAGTSPDSWAHQGSTEIPDQGVSFRPDTDDPGPLSIAVLVRFLPPAGSDRRSGRLMAFGDSDFAANLHFGTLGNEDLITAAFAVLAEEPVLIATGKSQRDDDTPPLVLTDKQTRTIFWTAFVLLPGTSLLLGLGVVRWRRRQRGGR